MRLFGPLYDRVLAWAAYPKAPWYLCGLSFAESSFFPVPPDVMLAPMSMSRPEQAFRFAWLTTVASVLGGVLGYGIGVFAMEWVTPWLQSLGYWDSYLKAQEVFLQWGFIAVLAAGFTPIPYKIFTISAGALGMNLPLFLFASLIGRGARFFLVAGLVKWGGKRMESTLRRYVEGLGWAFVGLLVIFFLVWGR
jgi:membrane protein YqaA with SNARE-associated domain